MTFKDVIKKSIYNEFQVGGVSTYEMGLIMIVALLFGILLFYAYKIQAKSAFYSLDINLSISCMPLIVSAIMIAMQENLMVSLGMVGALSIVRFRTAVKNPLDLLYYFLGISIGIIVGVRLFFLAVVLVLTVLFLIFALSTLPGIKAPKVLVVRSEKGRNEEIETILKEKCKKYKLMSTTVRTEDEELIYYIKTEDYVHLLYEMEKNDAVKYINIIEHSGELR